MSKFTDQEHLDILRETQKWEQSMPSTGEEHFLYAAFQRRIKDYSKALFHYKKALRMDFLPAAFGLLLCQAEGVADDKIPDGCGRLAYQYYSGKKERTPEDSYCLAMCCAYGLGTPKREEKAFWLFSSLGNSHGGAMFELGKAFEYGALGCEQNHEQALRWYRKSYDAMYEPAIFSHFALFHGTFEEYPYQREIKEAFSFRLGQLIRVTSVSPCRDSFRRVAEWYEQGYPGDSGEEDARFRRKALYYRKRENSCSQKYNYGTFLPHLDSELYQTLLQKEEMDIFGQSNFLENNL